MTTGAFLSLLNPSNLLDRMIAMARQHQVLSTPHSRAKLGFYSYAFACEVFSCVSVAVFLPILLEQLARSHGYVDGDTSRPCIEADGNSTPGSCSVQIGWSWVDTASFSLFIKSASVAVQAVSVISISVLADVGVWRKRLLLVFAYTGSTCASLFLFLPTSSTTFSSIVLFLAAVLAITSVACFGDSFVCLNAFLPGIVQSAPEVVAAKRKLGNEGDDLEDDGAAIVVDDEQTALMAGEAAAQGSIQEDTANALSHYHRTVSLTTSRISSIGVGMGYASGVGVLCLTIIPVTILRGSLFSLRLAIGLSGIWWAAFTLPAARLLPAITEEEAKQGVIGQGASRRKDHLVRDKIAQGWTRLGTMLHWREIGRLRVTFWYLLAWALLSDAFNTTTSLAVLFGKTSLGMPSSRVILIGILTQSTAILSALYTPRFQRRMGVSNLHMLIGCVVGVMLMCMYVLLGLIGQWRVGGLRTEGEMYACAVWFGILFGPFNALSRTVFAEIIPHGHEARFFSLFSITDKSASFLGPAVVGIIADATGEIRYGFLFLLTLLAVPIPILLWAVDVDRGREDAARYAQEESME